MITVVNVKSGASFDYYIGRPQILGNPYVVGKDGSRRQVIQLWKRYAMLRAGADFNFRSALLRCENKTVGCHCHPLECHGDTFDELIHRLTGAGDLTIGEGADDFTIEKTH